MILKKYIGEIEADLSSLGCKAQDFHLTKNTVDGIVESVTIKFRDTPYEFKIMGDNPEIPHQFRFNFMTYVPPDFKQKDGGRFLYPETIQSALRYWIQNINMYLEEQGEAQIHLTPEKKASPKQKTSTPKEEPWHSRLYNSWANLPSVEQTSALSAVIAFIFLIGFYFGNLKFDYDSVLVASERDKYKERGDQLEKGLTVSRDSVKQLLTKQELLSSELKKMKSSEIKKTNSGLVAASKSQSSKIQKLANPTISAPYSFYDAVLVLKLSKDEQPCDSATRFERISPIIKTGNSVTFRIFPKYKYDKWAFKICDGMLDYKLIGLNRSLGASIALANKEDANIYAKSPYSKCVDKNGCLVEYIIKP